MLNSPQLFQARLRISRDFLVVPLVFPLLFFPWGDYFLFPTRRSSPWQTVSQVYLKLHRSLFFLGPLDLGTHCRYISCLFRREFLRYFFLSLFLSSTDSTVSSTSVLNCPTATLATLDSLYSNPPLTSFSTICGFR